MNSLAGVETKPVAFMSLYYYHCYALDNSLLGCRRPSSTVMIVGERERERACGTPRKNSSTGEAQSHFSHFCIIGSFFFLFSVFLFFFCGPFSVQVRTH